MNRREFLKTTPIMALAVAMGVKSLKKTYTIGVVGTPEHPTHISGSTLKLANGQILLVGPYATMTHCYIQFGERDDRLG